MYLEHIKNNIEHFFPQTGCSLLFTVDKHLDQEYFFILPIHSDLNLPHKT